MGCGCGGAKKTVNAVAPSASSVLAAGPKTYDVFSSEGTLVASSTNPTFARIEARRTGGTVVPRQASPATQ